MLGRISAAHSNSTYLELPTQTPRNGYRLLERILNTLESLPEAQALIATVRRERRNARPGYTPESMLRAYWLKYLLSERFTVGFIIRLESSPSLRSLCGFGDSVPSEPTFSRFYSRLADHPLEVERMIAGVVRKLKERLPDLGRIVVVDSTDIESYGNPNRQAPVDRDANWGVRTAKHRKPRQKQKGRKGETKKELFYGYKAHVLSDGIYGIPLALMLRPASENDTKFLKPLVLKAEELHGDWFRPECILADRGYDSLTNHQFCYGRGITPIIHIRRSPAKDKLHDGIYSRLGIPTCDGKTKMVYDRTDPETGEHIYHCPPDGCGLKERSSGAVQYCRTRGHRENPLDNLRVISVVARASPEWGILYKRRTVIERSFDSLKDSRLFDKSLYLEMRKVKMNSLLSLLTYAVTALARVEVGDLRNIRHMRIREIG